MRSATSTVGVLFIARYSTNFWKQNNFFLDEVETAFLQNIKMKEIFSFKFQIFSNLVSLEIINYILRFLRKNLTFLFRNAGKHQLTDNSLNLQYTL